MVLVQLNSGVQTYDWGKLGESSAVARFAAATDSSVKIGAETPYAELWMGTHPKVPSHVLGTEKTLRELVTEQPAALGEKIAAKFGNGELPFLFKVLSIRKALSIQAHPDKALAKELHARDPKNYPDDNHKPEMAIALTAFEGFCGFRPLENIASFIEHVPEFSELVGAAGPEFIQAIKTPGDHREALRQVVKALMTNDESTIAAKTDALVARAKAEGSKFAGPYGGQELADLTVRLDGQFPHDIGLFSGALMLNYVKLNKGEAMFLKAKDPHAYISGDIIECMAASDNVVRSGFTPKFKDVPTLVSMLTCDSGSVEDQKMVPAQFGHVKGGQQQYFNPPIEEFAVLQQTTPAGSNAQLSGLEGGSIFIVTEGEGSVRSSDASYPYKTGNVFFVGAGTTIEIEAKVPTVSYHAVTDLS